MLCALNVWVGPDERSEPNIIPFIALQFLYLPLRQLNHQEGFFQWEWPFTRLAISECDSFLDIFEQQPEVVEFLG